MQAIILAGGNGTRLRPLIATVPKPMLPLFDRPIMEQSIRLLAEHGIDDIIITTSAYATEIVDYFGDGSNWGVRIRYSVEHEPMGTAGSVKFIQKMIDDTFIVISGDVVSDFYLTEALARHKSASAIATILLSESDDPTQFGMVRRDPSSRVTHFIEKPNSIEATCATVNTGIYILEPDVLSCIPYDETFDFGRQLFPRMLNNQEPVYGFALPGYWADTGNVMHYRNLHVDVLAGRARVRIPGKQISEGIWAGEDVEIHPTAQLSGPVFLGNEVTIGRNAIIGGTTILGAGTVIGEGAVVTSSMICVGSHVGKNARVSECILGSGCHIAEDEAARNRSFIESVYYEIPEPTLPIRRDVPKPARPPRKAKAAKVESVKL